MKQTIFITGASSGIGKATAIYFADKGWNVAATMRDIDGKAELENHENIKLYALDVTNYNSINNAVTAAIADFGQIDTLLNNAGYGIVGPMETATEEDVTQQFNTNLFGVIRTIQAILPTMKKTGGTIINVTSIGGLVAFPFNSLYHATKFGLDGLSESLKYELKPYGIKVKVVAPGVVATDFGSRSLHTTFKEGQVHGYEDAFNKVIDVFKKGSGNASPAQLVAEVIYAAATDGKEQLRYLAGKDAEDIYASWKSASNEQFFENINKGFGLA